MRERLHGFDKAHRWETTYWAGPGSKGLDAVVCSVCGVNGWVARE